MPPGACAGEQLSAVEITYVDPKSRNICRREVFCDPADGEWRWQSRFLISSELVNLLSEAVLSRRARFKQRHDQLARYRFGYTCDLWRLRNSIDRIAGQAADAADAEGQGAACGASKRGEVCPVHYYRPELYLDSWTHERLEAAIRGWRKFLLDSIKELRDRINELGGSGWYDILGRMLRSGVAPMGIAGLLLGRADAEERREIENKLTGGLRDKLDALQPLVDMLEPEHDDWTARKDEVDLEIRQKLATIQSCEQRLRYVRKKLEEPPPSLAPDSESEAEEEPDDSAFRARVAEMIRKLLEEWAAKVAAAKEETARLRAEAEDWEARWKAYDKDELARLAEEVRELEQAADKLKRTLDKLNEREREIRAQVQELEEKMAEERKAMDDLRDKLSRVPAAPPKSLAFARLQRELRRLLAEEQDIRRKMLKPLHKVKAIRYELRGLYKKLGWDWDLSESENEEEKPYWMRRKLAVDGITPFDPNDFIYGERSFQSRRLKKTAKKESTKQESAILSQMVASRHLHSETVANLSRSLGAPQGGHEELLPFHADEGDPRAWSMDPVERAMHSTSKRLLASVEQSRTWSPRPARETAEIQALCAQLLRIYQQRSSCLEQLRQSAKCLPELLPAQGVLARPRARMAELVASLEARWLEPDLLEDQEEVEQEIEDICKSLQEVIAEAIRLSDKVSPISVALQHSVKFAELRARLAELGAAARQARGELRGLAGEELLLAGSVGSSTRLSSMRASNELFGSVLASSSGSTSPRPRPPLSPSKAAPTVPPLRPFPRLEALVEPLHAGCGGPGEGIVGRRRTGKFDGTGSLARSHEGVDFGFRPDGVGEEPLENWSLFKVSKEAAGTAGGPGGRAPGGDRGRASDAKAARIQQRLQAHCDFREYVSQTKQSSKEMWQSASAPDLLAATDQWKRGPSLPQLVRPEPPATAGGPQQGQQRKTPKSVRGGVASPTTAEGKAGVPGSAEMRRRGRSKTALVFRNGGW